MSVNVSINHISKALSYIYNTKFFYIFGEKKEFLVICKKSWVTYHWSKARVRLVSKACRSVTCYKTRTEPTDTEVVEPRPAARRATVPAGLPRALPQSQISRARQISLAPLINPTYIWIVPEIRTEELNCFFIPVITV